MKILGVGPIEFVFVIIVAVLVLGPEGIVNSSRKIGRIIRDIKSSELWNAVQDSKGSFTKMSKELIEDSGMVEIKDEIADLNALRDKGLLDIQKELAEIKNEPAKESQSK